MKRIHNLPQQIGSLPLIVVGAVSDVFTIVLDSVSGPEYGRVIRDVKSQVGVVMWNEIEDYMVERIENERY